MSAIKSDSTAQATYAMSSGEAYLEECRDRVLDEIRAIVRSSACEDKRAYDLMLDYPLRRAKGLRPALCIAVCRALGGDLEDVLPSAAVVEIYHNAFLIHDDIEDGSLMRRGSPALHQTHGIATAVNCGDGLLALTLRPLLQNTDRLGLGKALRILEIYAAMVTEAFEGQTQELRWIDDGTWNLDDADYESMVLKKTCGYSFVAPALVGAAVAGAGPRVRECLIRFLKSLGLAFQIQDDLLNLEEHRTDYGKEFAGDLWEGKRTLMLLHALRNASESDRTNALSVLRKPRPHLVHPDKALRSLLDDLEGDGVIDGPLRQTILKYEGKRAATDGVKSESDVVFLRDMIDARGSIEHARSVAKRHAETADSEWNRLLDEMPDSVHARFLSWLKDYVVRREW